MEKINVKNLVLGDVGASDNIEIKDRLGELELPEDMKADEVAGKIKLIRLEDSVLINGHLEVQTELFCDRCLESFNRNVEFDLDREYELDRTALSEEGLYIDKYLNVDITEPIREELILAVPMKRICKENCPGIKY